MSDNMTEPTQAVLDEAMMPELSEDFFEFEGKKVQIRPLKVKNQKMFAKAFVPVVESIAYDLAQNSQIMYTDENNKTHYRSKGFGDLGIADWALLSKSLLEQVEVLPKLIQILCHDDGHMVTDEEMDESRMQQKEMQEIILKFCKKSGEIERQIADFFEYALPTVQDELKNMLGQGKAFLEMSLLKAKESTDSTNTAS